MSDHEQLEERRPARCSRRGLRRLAGDTRGATVVEFGIVCVPFFFLLSAIFEQAFLFYKHEVLQTAISDSARMILTGQAKAASYNQSQFKTQVCSRLPSFIDCGTVAVDVRPYTNFTAARPFMPVDGSGNYDASRTSYDGGNAGSIVVVSGYSLQRVMFPMLNPFYSTAGTGKVLISAQAAFRNEPF